MMDMDLMTEMDLMMEIADIRAVFILITLIKLYFKLIMRLVYYCRFYY